MIRGLVLVFSLAGQPTARPASAGDRWFASDKVQHFFSTAFVQSISYGALRTTGLGHGAALTGASLASAGAAVGKELRDLGGRGDPSVKDLTWDAAGAAAATVLLVRTVR